MSENSNLINQMARNKEKLISELEIKVDSLCDWLLNTPNADLKEWEAKILEQNNLRFRLRRLRNSPVEFSGSLETKNTFHPQAYNPLTTY